MPPRRPRSKVNRDLRTGLLNRQWGMCTKANSFAQLYNVDIVVAIRRPDGRLSGYQSRPGVAKQLLRSTDSYLVGPAEVDSYQKKGSSTKMTHSITGSSPPHPSSFAGSSSGSEPTEPAPRQWIDDFPLPPRLLSPLPSSILSPDMNEFDFGLFAGSDYLPTVCPATLQGLNTTGEAEIIQPKPLSAGQQNAILSLINSYL